jgi:hypothetical protein
MKIEEIFDLAGVKRVSFHSMEAPLSIINGNGHLDLSVTYIYNGIAHN